jgi:hypothetical protein
VSADTMMRSYSLPLSFCVTLTGNSGPAGTSSSALPDPAEFETWLFDSAQTELGSFPDWPFLRDYARALIAGRKGLLPDENGELVGRDLTVLKRRQILISWVTAAWFHWTSANYPYDHGAVISSGKTASSKQGRRIRLIAEKDGYHGLGVDLLKYPNGSELTIFPSTESAAIGESLKKLHFDEFAFHRYAQQNLDSARPSVSNSNGQIIVTSTANPFMGNAGPFVDVWRATPKGQQRFYGRHVRPDQGPEFFAGEAKRPGMTVPVMNAFYPEEPEDAFVAHRGLVLPEFNETHIGAPKQKWAECKYRVMGADPGGGDHTAMLLVGVSQDESCVQVYAPSYYKAGGTSVDEYASFYSKAHKAGPVQAFVIGETGGNTIVTSLRRMNVRAEKAELKPDENKEWVRWLLENNLLRVDPSLTELIEEFRLWRWKPGTDEWTRETYMTNVGGKRHHDLMDCLGYAVARIIRQLRAARPMVVEQARQQRAAVR